MAFEFELPDVGEGIAEGEIVAWHVSAGDTVEEDQVMADVETDKAVVDLPAPVTGVITDLHAEEGEMVPVGDVVATINVDGETEDTDTGATDSPQDTSETSSTDTDSEDTVDDANSTDDQDAVDAGTGDGRVFAPPNVRQLARELGVDITAVDGTGPSGRITDSDVRAAAEPDEDETETKAAVTKRDNGDGADAETTAKTQTTTTTAKAANRDETLAAPATRGLADELGVSIHAVPTEKSRDGKAFIEEEDVRAFVEAEETTTAEPAKTSAEAESTSTTAGAETAQPTPTAGGAGEQPVETEAYRGVRRTIGEQMQESKYTAPHVTHHDMADVSALVEAREELKPRADDRGINMTYMPFVIKAIIAALKEYPVLNTELDEDNEEILYKHYYNIGIAVATDAGLMVPVVKDADEKGMLQVATEVNELATKARERKVSPDELQGSTFSITNFGAFGGEYATPIINYPETAILGLGAIKQRPVVEDGEVVAKHTLPLSLTIDHRVIDGAEAAQFCNTVMEYLENPTLLLLE
ncbi:dihydrolipoamide acetyltransferase family protein [Halovenus rubra]|uniref:Dihydrolipoamide acetyltransferase family protein n=2 Tax=Halovenus rubra TaxID=869890 RepID=A0ACC7DUS2_9EURY|nr:dihydrolipoamide acetyltransferase family protein [Halovenus rubra]